MERNNEAGQVLIIVVVVLFVLIGVMGLAIDMGYLRYMKRQLQTAADAAAIAGALELSSCPGGCGFGLSAAGQAASEENGFTNGTNRVTVTVNNPPTTGGDPHEGDSSYVEAIISQIVPTHFVSIFGLNSVVLAARGEAKVSSGSNCVYALNALSVIVGVLNSSCGIVVESNLTCAGSITASRIGIVGSTGAFGICITNPNPVNIAAPEPSDPLAYLPKPAVGSCGTSTTTPYSGSPTRVTVTGGNAVFNPGTYCGGIHIAGANATFSPGTYVLTSTGSLDGGLTIDLGIAAGSGVTFYNYGPVGGINLLGGSANFTAPTGGPYEGILFFQDGNDTQPASFTVSIGNSDVLTGAYYFPNATISFLADLGQSSEYTILDARAISFSVATFTIKNDYSSLPDGSPIKGGAVLVE